jgi:hypothetical protein
MHARRHQTRWERPVCFCPEKAVLTGKRSQLLSSHGKNCTHPELVAQQCHIVLFFFVSTGMRHHDRLACIDILA